MNRMTRRALRHLPEARPSMEAFSPSVQPVAALATLAYRIITDRMTRDFHNSLSQEHSEALMRLVGRLSFMAYGQQTGRWAMDLPCGCGKTQGVVAWLTAVHRLGLDKSVLVAASHIEGLIKIRADLLSLGVPENKIGLLHDKAFDPILAAEFARCGDYNLLGHRYASAPATTDNGVRQFLLVSHNRIRGAKQDDDKLSFINTYRGLPRDLVVWDEALISSQAWAISTVNVASGIGWLRPQVEISTDPVLKAALAYIESCHALIMEEQQRQAGGDKARLVQLPALTELEQDQFITKLSDFDATSPLRSLIGMNGCEIRVAPMGTSKTALVRYVLTVPRALINIAILDASHTVNKLVELDTTIRREPWFSEGRIIKSYETVTINYMIGPSGRASVEADFGARKGDKRKLPREIVSMIKSIPPEEAVIVFTFKHRPKRKDAVDIPTVLLKDLEAAGVDTKATLPNGKPRINVLTWGNHTSLSEYAYCGNVVFAGVLHRSDEDLAAAAIGQRDDLLVDLGELTSIEDIKRGEIANILYQAMSRGSSRFTENGRARPMKVWLVHHDPRIKEVLDKVMPGAVWTAWNGEHGSGFERKTYSAAVRIAEFLRGLSEETQQISSKRLKVAAGLADLPAQTFKDARNLLFSGSMDAAGWQLVGRSFVRTALAPFVAE
ncbi:MAG TPA: hypothetical protein VKY65_14610 [Alphaproteobacteria bacterium]|nr:hypothetical protein [Alphaproteobacteria bacterium]